MESNVLSSFALWWNDVMEGMWSAKMDPFESTCERRKRTAYTSWSTVFCHLPDSSSHKSTMTADAAPCSFTHRRPNDQIVISHRSAGWMISQIVIQL
jgi:hypothetical protein